MATVRTDNSEAIYRVDRVSFGTPDTMRRLKPAERTSDGFLIVEGIAAIPGVYEYDTAEGGVVRELVEADVLSDAAGLTTMAAKPVTFFHPPEQLVTPKTAGKHAVGTVLDAKPMDGMVHVRMVIHRADGIGALEAGIRDLSCGYVTHVERSPGVWTAPDGSQVTYDQRQTSRTYNHLAILPAGRHGQAARARLDASGETTEHEAAPMKIKKLIRIDGNTSTTIECESDVAEAIDLLVAARDAATSRADAAEATAKRLEGEAAAHKAAAETARADAEKVRAESSPEALQRRADARAALVGTAVKAGCVEAEVAKLDELGIKRAALTKRYPTMKVDGMEAGALEGAWTVLASELAAASPLSPLASTVPRGDEGSRNEDVFAFDYAATLRGEAPKK